MFKLGSRGIHVSVSDYRGYCKVNVRLYGTVPVSGKCFPTKTGICLSYDEWNDFKTQFVAIDETVQVVQSLIGENVLSTQTNQNKQVGEQKTTVERPNFSNVEASKGCIQRQFSQAGNSQGGINMNGGDQAMNYFPDYQGWQEQRPDYSDEQRYIKEAHFHY